MGKPKGYEPVIRRNGKGGQEFIQNTIRFPPNVYERIREEAEKSGRSLHSEILQRVVQSLGMELELEEPQSASLLQQIADDLRAVRQLAEQMATAAK